MPRRKVNLPTAIYWLFDMRPETLSVFPLGQPFYCGKTVKPVEYRLVDHRYGVTRFPKRKLSRMLALCGENVRVQTIEVVPPGSKWADRERGWITVLRSMNPDCVNISKGGDGVPGLIHSAETRAKISAAKTGKIGKPLSAETRAKIGAIHRGRKLTPEVIARRTASRKGWKPSAESRAKMSASQRGNKHSVGRKLSPDHVAKLRAGHRAYYEKSNA